MLMLDYCAMQRDIQGTMVHVCTPPSTRERGKLHFSVAKCQIHYKWPITMGHKTLWCWLYAGHSYDRACVTLHAHPTGMMIAVFLAISAGVNYMARKSLCHLQVDQVYFPHLEVVGDIGTQCRLTIGWIGQDPHGWDCHVFRVVKGSKTRVWSLGNAKHFVDRSML